MADADQDLPPGSRLLDRYTVIDCVAGGGMATIHRAVDERFDRIVCVKLLRLDLGGQSTASSKVSATAVFNHFLREARALSQLAHPNTLRIYDFGYLEDGQRPFQVSEFLDGGNLRQHVRARGPLRPEETLAVLECVTGAIAEAHGRHILHRDIKPSNILFARVGATLMPKLADFGIARTLRAHLPRADDPEDVRTTQTQAIGLFSPRWAAPEQLAGRPEGQETDVYALGLLTAYMLTGRSPFDGGDMLDVYDERARADDEIVRRLIDLGLARPVIPVVARALRGDAAARTATAVAFFDEVRGALGGVRSSLPLTPPAPESGASLQRRPSAPPAPPAPPRIHPAAPAAAAPRSIRVAEVHEKLEVDLVGVHGEDVRLRVSILPARPQGFQIQIKGLNCFVSRVDRGGAGGAARMGLPSPALTATQDGVVDLVSLQREPLARISFAFGAPASDGGGHVFRFAAGDVVVPLSGGAFTVALDLGPEREMVVLCKRA